MSASAMPTSTLPTARARATGQAAVVAVIMHDVRRRAFHRGAGNCFPQFECQHLHMEFYIPSVVMRQYDLIFQAKFNNKAS